MAKDVRLETNLTLKETEFCKEIMLTVKRWSIQPGFPAGPGIANTK